MAPEAYTCTVFSCSWGPLLAWLLLQLAAWSHGSTSAYGYLFGLYLVRGEEQEQRVAGGGWAAMAQLVGGLQWKPSTNCWGLAVEAPIFDVCCFPSSQLVYPLDTPLAASLFGATRLSSCPPPPPPPLHTLIYFLSPPP